MPEARITMAYSVSSSNIYSSKSTSTQSPGALPRVEESYVPEVKSDPVGRLLEVALMLTVSVPGLEVLYSFSLTDVTV